MSRCLLPPPHHHHARAHTHTDTDTHTTHLPSCCCCLGRGRPFERTRSNTLVDVTPGETRRGWPGSRERGDGGSPGPARDDGPLFVLRGAHDHPHGGGSVPGRVWRRAVCRGRGGPRKACWGCVLDWWPPLFLSHPPPLSFSLFRTHTHHPHTFPLAGHFALVVQIRVQHPLPPPLPIPSAFQFPHDGGRLCGRYNHAAALALTRSGSPFPLRCPFCTRAA